jgi:hypothetical protein
MKSLLLNQQRGAVMAFTLVMLLLLTIASMSMVRQNKAQIAIATNTGQQTQVFATVETALRRTQAALEPLRYSDKANKHCLSGATNSIHPVPHASSRIDIGDSSVIAEIHDEYCISNYVNGKGDENRCIYSAPGVRNLTVAANHAEPTQSNVDACSRLNLAGNWSAGHRNDHACQIEVYTLHVTLTDISGAKRIIESKFEIDCSGDLNP